MSCGGEGSLEFKMAVGGRVLVGFKFAPVSAHLRAIEGQYVLLPATYAEGQGLPAADQASPIQVPEFFPKVPSPSRRKGKGLARSEITEEVLAAPRAAISPEGLPELATDLIPAIETLPAHNSSAAMSEKGIKRVPRAENVELTSLVLNDYPNREVNAVRHSTATRGRRVRAVATPINEMTKTRTSIINRVSVAGCVAEAGQRQNKTTIPTLEQT